VSLPNLKVMGDQNENKKNCLCGCSVEKPRKRKEIYGTEDGARKAEQPLQCS
jgi:hypothetical protein